MGMNTNTFPLTEPQPGSLSARVTHGAVTLNFPAIAWELIILKIWGEFWFLAQHSSDKYMIRGMLWNSQRHSIALWLQKNSPSKGVSCYEKRQGWDRTVSVPSDNMLNAYQTCKVPQNTQKKCYHLNYWFFSILTNFLNAVPNQESLSKCIISFKVLRKEI